MGFVTTGRLGLLGVASLVTATFFAACGDGPEECTTIGCESQSSTSNLEPPVELQNNAAALAEAGAAGNVCAPNALNCVNNTTVQRCRPDGSGFVTLPFCDSADITGDGVVDSFLNTCETVGDITVFPSVLCPGSCTNGDGCL